MKKYKVWLSIDQAFQVEAKNAEEARELVESGEFSDDDIVEERNWEFIALGIVQRNYLRSMVLGFLPLGIR